MRSSIPFKKDAETFKQRKFCKYFVRVISVDFMFKLMARTEFHLITARKRKTEFVDAFRQVEGLMVFLGFTLMLKILQNQIQSKTFISDTNLLVRYDKIPIILI